MLDGRPSFIPELIPGILPTQSWRLLGLSKLCLRRCRLPWHIGFMFRLFKWTPFHHMLLSLQSRIPLFFFGLCRPIACIGVLRVRPQPRGWHRAGYSEWDDVLVWLCVCNLSWRGTGAETLDNHKLRLLLFDCWKGLVVRKRHGIVVGDIWTKSIVSLVERSLDMGHRRDHLRYQSCLGSSYMLIHLRWLIRTA